MGVLIRHICEYRRLRGRRDLLCNPLDHAESERLDLLEHLFGLGEDAPSPTPPVQGRRRFTRAEVEIRATVSVGEDDVPIRILNLGGGGVMIAPAPDLNRGDLTILKIVDEIDGPYRLPAQVMWVTPVPDGLALGLAFVGLPLYVES
jgi:hypothetical protein